MMSCPLHPGLNLLQDVPVGTLLPEGDRIVSLSSDVYLSTAFKTLVENKILSAPVYDTHKRSFASFVDIVDVVTFFVSNISNRDLLSSDDNALLQIFANEKIEKISGLSGRNPYYPVEAMAPLLSAVLLMVKWGVHRVPVVDSEGELITVMTQSHVVKYIYRHLTEFGSLSRNTIESLGLVHSPVISVGVEQSIMDAFKTMHEKHVSGVAVVDTNGTLVGNISASDLKLIGYDGTLFSKLKMPVSRFLHETAKEKNAVITAPVCVKAHSTFSEVVSKLVDNKIHRVYLVDDMYLPVGVITQLEVLRAIIGYLHVQVY